MGTFKLPTRVMKTTAASVMVLLASAAHGDDFNLKEAFPNVESIERWATVQLRHFEKHQFSNGGKEAVVVIGLIGSGIPRSVIYLLDKEADGSYRFVLVRVALRGIVKVKQDSDGLIFYGKTPVLIVPWGGIGVVNEQL